MWNGTRRRAAVGRRNLHHRPSKTSAIEHDEQRESEHATREAAFEAAAAAASKRNQTIRRGLTSSEPCHVGGERAVAAQEPVPPQTPQFASKLTLSPVRSPPIGTARCS